MKSTQTPQITKEMTIADILDIAPDSVPIMLEAGLHCIGCDANLFETLEEGMLGHGFADADIDAMVQKINTSLENGGMEYSPKPEDFIVQKRSEDDELLYDIAGITLTEKAYRSLHDLSEGKKGLRIEVSPGGCSGYSYEYDFTDTPHKDDKIYQLSDSLALFLNDFSFSKIFGSFVDFQSGLHGSGLTFDNPNSKGSCGCGSSVGF